MTATGTYFEKEEEREANGPSHILGTICPYAVREVPLKKGGENKRERNHPNSKLANPIRREKRGECHPGQVGPSSFSRTSPMRERERREKKKKTEEYGKR